MMLFILALGFVPLSCGGCPFAGVTRLRRMQDERQLPPASDYPELRNHMSPDDAMSFQQAASALDWEAVKADITALLVENYDFWPHDFNSYGPLMIRLAWHCAGTYRKFDGLGGCDGARQRFEPEESWPDNTNLDKARRLLVPIKQKYGNSLSWGDLIILTGNVAIASMGGPVLGFCAGRMDDPDGTDSLLLGPTAEQELHFPCPVNGNCSAPLGQSTIGLIYVNPEGVMGQPVPERSVSHIRDVFGRMAMNDSETVALIGGGHAFGKVHGACPAGPGPDPKESPDNPWPGACGTGRGNDTFTSGFEGQWTTKPTQWTNYYFQQLRDHEYKSIVGPGGHHQWVSASQPNNTMMLTTDVALTKDPEYVKLIEQFASDQPSLDTAFSHAWYKLVTRDMGPRSRCLGPWVPPAQPFQNPLPPPGTALPDYSKIKQSILKVMRTENKEALPADKTKDGKADYTAVLTNLAWQCASTFRNTDYQGGCNGARIRFKPGVYVHYITPIDPERDWPNNAGSREAIKLLEPLKEEHGDSLSWSDLIVLAGTTALESACSKPLNFCGGRTDAANGDGSESLQPFPTYNATAFDFLWKAGALGLTDREFVALYALPRSPLQMRRLGFKGSWQSEQGVLNNQYFTTLLEETWVQQGEDWKAEGKDLYVTSTDILIREDEDLRPIAQLYAKENDIFVSNAVTAWQKIMIADRFDGPAGNICVKQGVEVPATVKSPTL